MTSTRTPALLVGIDTEGDNQWDLRARQHQTFENIHALKRLHEFFERHGVHPTYFTTYPVASDPRSGDVLRALAQRGRVRSPLITTRGKRRPAARKISYGIRTLCRFPLRQFDAQLESLTTKLRDVTGHAPVSYRSGRFGFAAAHVSSLERHGYLIDSSVVPLFYEAHKGGPDFADAPIDPYFLSYDSATRPGSSNVMELPVSSALNRNVNGGVARLFARAPWPYQTKRALRLLRIVELQTLRPSYHSAATMIALAKRLTRQDRPILNLFFHSSEAIAGGSPYNRTAGDLDGFFERLATFLDFAVRELHVRPMTFEEFRHGANEQANEAMRQ